MTRNITFVGMDAHKASISVAMLLPGEQRAVEWKIDNRSAVIARLAKRLKKDSLGDVVACYEAGPTGYALMRQLESLGVSCKVIAPALIPKRAGDHVKTDKRDARKLASLFRAGLLTEVHPPTPEQEAVRDLCRARDDARDDRARARHRLGKFLLRHGLSHTGKAWTLAHRRWLSTLRFEHDAGQTTFDDYFRAVDAADERITTLDEKIAEVSTSDAYREAVGVLRCFRGIDTTSAMVLLSELGDIARFESPRRLMAYLGLTPSEYSSGPKQKRGGITKAGNAFVRRILIEAAWHYRHRPHAGARLRKRREGQPGWAIALADKAQSRLYRRGRHLVVNNNKPSTVANVAVARELSAFVWRALIASDSRNAAA
jgi:transposase